MVWIIIAYHYIGKLSSVTTIILIINTVDFLLSTSRLSTNRLTMAVLDMPLDQTSDSYFIVSMSYFRCSLFWLCML